MIKAVILVLIGCSLGGCVTLTPGEKAYNACLDRVPEEVARVAEGEVDVYQTETPVTLTKGDRLSPITSISSEPRCSPACLDAREEKSRIVSDCYRQWQDMNPSENSSS